MADKDIIIDESANSVLGRKYTKNSKQGTQKYTKNYFYKTNMKLVKADRTWIKNANRKTSLRKYNKFTCTHPSFIPFEVSYGIFYRKWKLST